MPEPSHPDTTIVQRLLYVLSFLCVVGAIGHSIWPERVDEQTVMFIGLAAVMLIVRDITTIEFPGWKIEKVRQELREEVKQVDRKVELIEEKGSLPGVTKRITTAPSVDEVAPGSEWDTDPNKGKFGGLPTANGRVLEATITPAAGQNSAACNVFLRVRSIDPQDPLTGDVVFYLHPTFKPWAQYSVPVKRGVAEHTITSWGRFTVGAEADGGKTRLELDLADVPGGTPKFYAQ